MPKKRSRGGQSQGFGDIDLLNQHPSPEFRWEAALPANFPDQSRQSILTVSSSPLMNERERGGLYRCYQCKKRLEQSQDIYMYGDSAFCTHECRNVQIAIDNAAEGIGTTRTSSRGMHR